MRHTNPNLWPNGRYSINRLYLRVYPDLDQGFKLRLVAVRNTNCERKSTRCSIASGSIQTPHTKEDITRLNFNWVLQHLSACDPAH